MNIAVIPARGGSKRIPRKNIKDFCGKPMIAHAILTAKLSGLFEHIIVSTDDSEIAERAVEWCAEVPFMRHEDLADDYTPTVPVIAHAVGVCEELGWSVDYVCCIYPCAPFVEADDLAIGLKMLKETGADYVYPVAEFSHPVQRAMFRSENGAMNFMCPECEMVRTQDLPKTYHDAGQFYWGKSSAWMDLKKMHSQGLGLVVPPWRVVDIDTLDDWHRAELLYQVMQVKKED